MKGHLVRSLVVSAAAALVVASFGWGAPASAAVDACWTDVYTDLDGNGPDVVIGLPSYDLPGKPDAGAIVVFSNVAAQGSANPRPPTMTTLLVADDFNGSSQAGARFGAALSVWQDVGAADDADDCADLLVGAPGQTVLGQVGAGQVYLIGGSPGVLSEDLKAIFDETMPGADGPEPGDGFGSAIAASTNHTLAIGVPGRDINEIEDAGRVIRLNWTGSDTDPEVVTIDQNFDEDENAEFGDRFGEVLELLATGNGDYLLVGIPREDVGATVDAGAVELFSPDSGSASMVTQNRAGAGGSAEAGDRYGSSISAWWTFTTGPTARVAIGVPGEDIGSTANAGMVSFATWTMPDVPEAPMPQLTGMSETQHQNSTNIPGAVETGDRYGTSVLTGEFGHDSGPVNLVVSAPLEDLGSVQDAGQLSQTRFETDASPSTGTNALAWTQDSLNVSGKAETGDRFAARLSSIPLTSPEDDDDLVWDVVLVTVPGEDLGDVVDAGLAYLGYAPGQVAVPLKPPTPQVGAGAGMVPMKVFLG